MKMVMERWWNGVEWEGKRSAWTKTCHIFTLPIKRAVELKKISGRCPITIRNINTFFSSYIPVMFSMINSNIYKNIYNTYINL